jgi:hypothetical protein
MLGFLESLLPGTRSLRPVLFAGLLWAVLLWVILESWVPSRTDADGMASQAYELATFLGPVFTGLVLGVGIFILGALAAPLHALASLLVGRGLRRIANLSAWQGHAQRRRDELMTLADRQKAQLEELEIKLDDAARLAAEEPNLKQHQAQLRSLRKQVEGLTKRQEVTSAAVSALPTKRLVRGRYIRNTAATRNAIGDPPVVTERSVEYQLMKSARDRGAEESLDKFAPDSPLEEALEFADERRLIELTTQLRNELEPDPLDLLHALDESHYLEMDRERAEREVRLAISVPLALLGLMIALEATPWGWILVVAAALLFARSALAASAEPARVINLIRLRGLQTPTVLAAVAQGREDVRQHAKRLIAEQREEEARAERQRRFEEERAQARVVGRPDA